MIRILSLLMLLVSVTAFTQLHQPKWGTVSKISNSKSIRFMFNADNDNKNSPPALQVVNEMSSTSAASEAVEEVVQIRNVVKDMNTGELKEVKWVDPAMRANTRPWEMSWWAYIAFGFPIVLLANDFIHFLPKDGPLGFFGRM